MLPDESQQKLARSIAIVELRETNAVEQSPTLRSCLRVYAGNLCQTHARPPEEGHTAITAKTLLRSTPSAFPVWCKQPGCAGHTNMHMRVLTVLDGYAAGQHQPGAPATETCMCTCWLCFEGHATLRPLPTRAETKNAAEAKKRRA